jgi:hypothetical protein
MRKSSRSKTGLVIEHLEGISRSAMNRYPDIITEFARGRSGVYALYKGKDLYYVGLAKNLRSRLHGHIRDRHAEAWDHFNIYLTQGDEHLKELESLVLRIASPKGNRISGKFLGSSDLKGVFRKTSLSARCRAFPEITPLEENEENTIRSYVLRTQMVLRKNSWGMIGGTRSVSLKQSSQD